MRRLESANPYVFAGQYMQTPAPKGGGLYKQDWFRYYEVEPTFKYRLMFADTAMKTKEANDYSVLQVWGYTANKDAYLIDQLRGKWESPELQQMTISFWDKHKNLSNGSLRNLCVEDKASGTGLIQSLKRDNKINVKAIQRSTDKITRAYDAAPYIASGRVYFLSGASYLSDLIPELLTFPNAKHDDQVDVLNDGISELAKKSSSFFG
jgi:predicted phage terminase large subunit-like protein